MKVIMKYSYPEKGTRNGRIYSPEVLKKAFNEPIFKEHCRTHTVPVTSENGELVGMGTAYLKDGNVVTVDAEVFSPAVINAIKTADRSIGFTLAGYGNVVYRNGANVVTDFNIDSAMLCAHPAVDCTTWIYEED